MADLVCRPFHPGDAERIVLREADARALACFDAWHMIRSVAERGEARVVEAPEGLVAVVVLIVFWPGVAEVWMVASDLIERYPAATTRLLRDQLDGISEARGLWRVQAYVVDHHVQSRRWLVKCLGFGPEGVLRRYGPRGEDYLMYARIRGS